MRYGLNHVEDCFNGVYLYESGNGRSFFFALDNCGTTISKGLWGYCLLQQYLKMMWLY